MQAVVTVWVVGDGQPGGRVTVGLGDSVGVKVGVGLGVCGMQVHEGHNPGEVVVVDCVKPGGHPHVEVGHGDRVVEETVGGMHVQDGHAPG